MSQIELPSNPEPRWRRWGPIALWGIGALLGLAFAALSTYDYVQHLDRQLHGIHCSFIPGVGSLDASGTSGCAVALMSPWSAVLRSLVWGGIPVALPGFAVFAFLVWRGVDMLVSKLHRRTDAWTLLLIASALPVLSSVVMGTISVVALGTVCKLCIGIYLGSALVLGGAVWGLLEARRAPAPLPTGRARWQIWVQGGCELAAFVAVPLAAYLALLPDVSGLVTACQQLPKPDDNYGVLVPLDSNPSGIPVIEVLDPLCPACKAFERRMQSTGRLPELHRSALLFPLDNACNWMVTTAMHPGACTVSEAVLCAGDEGAEVLAWAYENQEVIHAASAADPFAAASMVEERFPDLAGCVGSDKVRARINRSLRWAVANQLPVTMPQMFIDGKKLCDEDIDLGLDYALARMLEPTAAVAEGGDHE